MKVLLAGVATVGLLAAGAQADWIESGDAGDWVDSAQGTGAGALNTISGATDGAGDWVDAYTIKVTDVAAFYATTNVNYDPAAISTWDTRLWLVDQAGNIVFANDDAPGPGLQSYISDSSTYVANTGGVLFNNPGSIVAGETYTLIISGFANDPVDTGGVEMTNLNSDFDALQGPNPASNGIYGGSWQDTGSSGEYTIALAGAMGVPAPGVLALLGLAGLAGTRRRRG